MSQQPDHLTAGEERQVHRYAGYDLPWYVHAIWVSFWIMAIYYVWVYLVPALQREWAAPP